MTNHYRICAATALALLLAGCAGVKSPEMTGNPFMAHWQNQVPGREGFSPAMEDLEPEPRVLMTERPTTETEVVRKLPDTPVTLKLLDVDTASVLRTLGQAAGLSMMLSPGISGTVTLSVTNEPWSDVFLSVLKANGLEYRWSGKILRVSGVEEKSRELALLKLSNEMAQRRAEALRTGPLGVSVVNIRYAEAADLQKSLTHFLDDTSGAVIEIDQHNNALIIQATEAQQRRLVAMIEHLDRPRPQVQLRAHIIETTKEKARELGMAWGGVMRTGTITGGDRGWIGTGGALGDPTGGLADGAENLMGTPLGLNYGELVNGSGVGNVGFALGRVGGNILEAQLNLMEREGVLNILSSPSITTLDNKMAYTENGEKVPYVSKNEDGDNEVKFEDAVLRLEMTPNVIDGTNLKLKVLIKKDEVDTSRAVDGNPFIIKKQTETTVMLRTGETIVISGLTKERGVGSDAGVPGLRDLPGGRYAFGSTNRTQQMEEVLIFITPTILPTRTARERAKPQPLPESPSAMNFREEGEGKGENAKDSAVKKTDDELKTALPAEAK